MELKLGLYNLKCHFLKSLLLCGSYFLLTIFFSFYSPQARAQAKLIDSLEAQLTNYIVQDSNRLNTILYLLSMSKDLSKRKALAYSDEAISLANVLKITEKEALAHFYKGKTYSAYRDYDEGNFSLGKSVSLFSEAKKSYSEAYSRHLLALNYHRSSRYEDALIQNIAAFKIFEKLGRAELMMESLSQTALVYRTLKDYSLALDCYNRLVLLAEKAKLFDKKIVALTAMGELYQFLGEFDMALSFYEQILNEVRKSELIKEEFYTLIKIADLYQQKNQELDSRNAVYRMLAISNTPSTNDRYAFGLTIMANHFIKFKAFDSAIHYLDKFSEVEKESYKWFNLKAIAYNHYGQAYYGKGNFIQALSSLENSILFFRKSKQYILFPQIYRTLSDIYQEISVDDLYKMGKTESKDFYYEKTLLEGSRILDSLAIKGELAGFKKKLALFYAKGKNFEKAYSNYRDAVDIANNLSDNGKDALLLKKLLILDFRKKEDSLLFLEKITNDELIKQNLVNSQISQELKLKESKLVLSQKEKELVVLSFLKAQTDLENERLNKQQYTFLENEKNNEIKSLNKQKVLDKIMLADLSKDKLNSKLKARQQILYSVIAFLLLGIFAGVFFQRSRLANLKLKSALIAEKSEKEISEVILQSKIDEEKQSGLRSQMNPHFIFNVLNSINKYILTSETTIASDYLIGFSKLIRMVLENSKATSIPLQADIDALQLYINMEKMRFEDKFESDIIIEEGIDTQYVMIPPLIIQPYVENAIWHGLLQKDGDNKLTIHISQPESNRLLISITDNGIGRQKAMELNSKSVSKNKSFGMQITKDRIENINARFTEQASVIIEDLYDENSNAAGTRVSLHLPI